MTHNSGAPQVRLPPHSSPFQARIDKARAIKSEHKALGVVCFGYFRYRNARFGCAEVHQSIQAYGRAGMTQARTLAEKDGYTVVHTLTDCIFMQRLGVTLDDASRIARKITREIGVPMDVEGVYKWLVLLPSKTHSRNGALERQAANGPNQANGTSRSVLVDDRGGGLVGVPNRYYGKFHDGTLKVRGIEVQRHSTAPFLYDVQQGMLDELAQANTGSEFMAKIPAALEVARRAALRLRSRDVEVRDLGVMVQSTRSVEEYTAGTATKAALKALRDAGTERRPGEFVKYVVTRRKGPLASRAKPVELLGETSWFGDTGGREYDVEAYVRLLARSVETLLSPFGYLEDNVHGWLMGRRPTAAAHRESLAAGGFREPPAPTGLQTTECIRSRDR